MPDFDYSTRPQMPQFRDPNGRLDWRQILDMVVPGNMWNSHTNQYRPLGIAEGLTGIPVDTAYGLYQGIRNSGVGDAARRGAGFMGNLFRGRGGRADTFRGDRTWMGPSGAGPSNYTGPINFGGADNWGTGRQSGVDPNWRMPGVMDYGPRPMRDGQGGYNGQSWSSARGLGEGMRRTGDQIIREQLELIGRMRDRGGMTQER